MKALLCLGVFLLVGCSVAPDIPPVEYKTDDVRGVIGWVVTWVEYVSDKNVFDIAAPQTTYETRKGNCEAMTALAMYLLRRDLGIESEMAVGQTSEGWHAAVLVDGQIWDATTGWRLEGTPTFTLAYDTVMALAGAK